MKKFISRLKRRGAQIKVYALVGKAGSGKSFRARLVMEKHTIDLLIDDGLLIKGQRILAGRSAKRETMRFKAVKRAVFHDKTHADEMKAVLEKERFRSILLLGTSEHMIELIHTRLNLPAPSKMIYIDDIATQEEIAHARDNRKRSGKHVIPVPVIEVKQDPAHRILDSVKLFIYRHPLKFWKKDVVEKAVVQPPFGRMGKLSISEAALSQMILHCVKERTEKINVHKIHIASTQKGYSVEILLCVPPRVSLPDALADLHDYIIFNVESFSGIHIDELDLTVHRIQC